MSEELYSKDSLSITQFFGGVERGACLQINKDSRYIQLSQEDTKEILPYLVEWTRNAT